MTDELSRNERIKEASDYLRGTLAEGLREEITGAIVEDDQQLVKFHGMYLQDDRDLRAERTRKKMEKAFAFMLRVRIPGGVLTPAQWLALDQSRATTATARMRLTTRQTFQLHGVIKSNLKATHAGDRRRAAQHHRGLRRRQPQRDVQSPIRISRRAHAAAHRAGARDLRSSAAAHAGLSRDLARRRDASPAARTRWSSRSTARPTCRANSRSWSRCRRRTTSTSSRTTSASSPSSTTTGDIAGWNVTVGGGMGMTHGEPDTYPRTADVLGFCETETRIAVAEAVVTVQRDWGDRANRKHARLKYTIEDRGLDAFRAEVETPRRRQARRGAALHVHLDRRPLRLERGRRRPRPSHAVRRERPHARRRRRLRQLSGAARDRRAA